MSDTVIKVEKLSKKYRLGVVGSSTIREEINHLWAKLRGREAPRKISDAFSNNTPNNKTVWALDNINFEVKRGETLGIIGKNGAGKSTLLKILSKVTSPTRGSIFIKGSVSSLLEVGTGFHPELTGRENIFLNGAILGMSKQEIHTKLEEIVNFAEINKYIDTPVKRYSSGMYVRLAFAVAAHLQPEILIIDEVLAVGDIDFQQKCINKLKNFSEEGKTIILVSHNLINISRLCSKTMYLKSGNVNKIGKTQDVLNLYFKDNSLGIKRKSKKHIDNPYFTDLLILDTSYNEKKVFYTNEKVIFQIHWVNPKAFKNLRLGFAINSFTGNRLFGSTPEDQKLVTNQSAGKHAMELELPKNTLLEGSYTVDLALYDKQNSYDYPQKIVQFTMMPAKEGVYTFDNNRDGFVQIPLIWKN